MRRRTMLKGLAATAGIGPSAALGRALLAQAVESAGRVRFDVRGAGLKPSRSGPVGRWGDNGPGGVLTANDCHLEKDGRPLPIVAGELHIQRVPPTEWEAAIVQMKAAGLNTISSYVFWNQIEPERGNFDFSGRNDLQAFFSLCQRHGMMALLRPGPFANAEFLLGGLPVWLYGLPTTERSNDSLYLDLVRRYFGALAVHLNGQFWHQGGPIVMVQLENELAVAPIGWSRPFLYGASVVGHTGPAGVDFTQHYRNLHAIAVAAGLRAPFYSATAWGTKERLPIDTLMPTFGGYMDLVPAGPVNNPLTIFDFEGRVYDGKVPVGFVEIGYGTPIRDAFRPRPSPDGGYASTLTLFGASRSLMIGYYMFRGGSNPVHGVDGWTTKDAVFPLVSYDFRAPIGEFGEWREAFHRARPFNHFVRNFALELARAEPRTPERPVTDPADDRVRAEARFDGHRGFVFISNYANVHPLSQRREFSVSLETEHGTVRIPYSGGVTLASGAMAIWPVNLELGGGLTLRSATAQPVCRLSAGNTEWIVMCQTAGVPVELAIERARVSQIRVLGTSWRPAAGDGPYVIEVTPSRNGVIEMTAADGTEVRLLVLPERDAQRLAQLGSADRPLLAISDAMVTQEGDTLSIASRTESDLAVSIFPPLLPPTGRVSTRADGIFRRVAFEVSSRPIQANVTRLGPERLLVKLPATAFEGVDEIYMDLRYSGDVCRVFDAGTGRLEADDMNDGQTWSIGLSRYRQLLDDAGLLIRVEPELVGTSPVQLDGGMTLTASQRAKGAAARLSDPRFEMRHVVRWSIA